MKYTLSVLLLVIFVGVWQGYVLGQDNEQQQQWQPQQQQWQPQQQEQDFAPRTKQCSYRCLQGKPKSKSWSNNINNHDSYSMYQVEQQQQKSQASTTWYYYDNFNGECREFNYVGVPTQKTLQTQNIHYSEASCIRNCELPCNQQQQQQVSNQETQDGQVSQGGRGGGGFNANNLRATGGGCSVLSHDTSGKKYCWKYCDGAKWCWTGFNGIAAWCYNNQDCSANYPCTSFCDARH